MQFGIFTIIKILIPHDSINNIMSKSLSMYKITIIILKLLIIHIMYMYNVYFIEQYGGGNSWDDEPDFAPAPTRLASRHERTEENPPGVRGHIAF